MTTLEEAWTWFRAARDSLKRLPRLAECWDELPWDVAGFPLERDGQLNKLTARQLGDDAATASRPLNDLAVLVLFSVFEGIVRAAVVDQIKPELVGLRHPSLRLAATQAIDLIEEGSFARVLEPYKGGRPCRPRGRSEPSPEVPELGRSRPPRNSR